MTYLERIAEIDRLKARINEIKPTYLEKLEHYKKLLLPKIESVLNEFKEAMKYDFEVYLSQYVDPYEEDWIGGFVELVVVLKTDKEILDVGEHTLTMFAHTYLDIGSIISSDDNYSFEVICDLEEYKKYRTETIRVI